MREYNTETRNTEPNLFTEIDIPFLTLEAETMANEKIDQAIKHAIHVTKAMNPPKERNTNYSFDLSMDEEFMDVFNQGSGTEEDPYLILYR